MQGEVEPGQVNGESSDDLNSAHNVDAVNRRFRIPKSWLFAVLLALIALAGYVISETCSLTDSTEQCYP